MTKIFSFVTLLGCMPLAFADAAPTSGAHGSALSSMIMFGAIFVMMYFLMIRPQSKRAKEHRNMLTTLGKDDEVVTSGGLLGRIARESGNFFILSLAEGVEVPVQKQSIVQVLPKGTLKTIC